MIRESAWDVKPKQLKIKTRLSLTLGIEVAA
jgi:hypothetical protein